MARYLKKILDLYSNELLSPNVHDRQEHFGWLEVCLQQANAQMDALKPRGAVSLQGRDVVPVEKPVASVRPGAGRVKALAAFHEQQIKNVGAVDRQAECIVRLRQWVHRQGGRLTPDGKIVWSKSTAVLKYDSELAQQAMTKIEIRKGLLYAANGQLLDTSKMVTAASGPGHCIYVMSAEDRIHVSSHAVGARHHSSLLAGQQVACAGEMMVRRGRLIALSNKSGHYQPEPVYLTQVIRVLARAGVPEDSYAVLELGVDRKIYHMNARLFMSTQVVPAWPKGDQLIENARYNHSYVSAVHGSGSPSQVVYGESLSESAVVEASDSAKRAAESIYGAYH